MRHRPTPAWRSWPAAALVLVVAGAGQVIAIALGAFDVPPGSVFAGRSVSLPLQLLIAPIVGWLAATLLIAMLLQRIAERAASRPARAELGSLVPGLLWRSVTRRAASVAAGVATTGLVVGLGAALVCFTTVYGDAKAVDARFLAGADIRVTPNPTSAAPHPASLAPRFEVGGITDATPVVYSPQNAVLTSAFNEDVATLAAIDPLVFDDVADLQDSWFVDGSGNRMMRALHDRPAGVLVNSALAKGLKVEVGDTVKVMFGRGTDRQIRERVPVLGLFTQFPGAPGGTDIVANLAYYEQVTHLTTADYYLAATADRGRAGLDRAVHGLSSLASFRRDFTVQTSAETLDKDQSSLTALNVRGLLLLDSLFTFLMAAAATAMFVFGMLLQRRREYVTLRAQGVRSREIRRLVLAESAISAALGSGIGIAVGVALASQLILVLRPIFRLPPPLETPVPELVTLAALVAGATALSSVAATVLIARLKPTELLRDE
jgi:ABC-type lipoprotein release transport system permease subunit